MQQEWKNKIIQEATNEIVERARKEFEIELMEKTKKEEEEKKRQE